ncbi:hypothetical protein FRB98_005372 [Tulasnella sp. 332]|nr:hypothetical protein FRB98_005372 [Tulasnella sp. 332]
MTRRSTRQAPPPIENDENRPPSTSHHTPTRSRRAAHNNNQLQDTTNSRNAIESTRASKRSKQNAPARAHIQNEQDTIASNNSDSNEVKELKAQLNRAEAGCRAAERKLSALAGPNGAANPEDETVQKPKKMSTITVSSIRQEMDLSGKENDDEWQTVRIEFSKPCLRRFRNHWATEHLAKEAFHAHKSYITCKTNVKSYRGKLHVAHKHLREERDEQEPYDNDQEQEHSDNDNDQEN